MRQTILLTGLELTDLWGLNTLRHTRDKKLRRKKCLLSGCLLLVILYIMAALAMQSCAVIRLGCGDSLPGILILTGWYLVFIAEIYNRGLYSPRGLELLASLPLSRQAVPMSRMLRAYLRSLLLMLGLMLPSAAVYGFMLRPEPDFYLLLLLSGLFLPMVPLAAAMVLNTLIALLTARSRRKKAAETFYGTLVLILCLGIQFFASGRLLSASSPAELLRSLPELFPPAAALGQAIVRGRWTSVLLLSAVSLLVLAAVGALILSRYERLSQMLLSVRARHRGYELSETRSGLLCALYRKEARACFSCPVYVSNTVIGPVLAVIGSAALLFFAPAVPEDRLPLPLWQLVPVVWSCIACMMTAASVSFSMEGSRVWLMKSLPVPVAKLINAKLLWSLTLLLPAWLLSEPLLFFALHPGTGEALWLLLFPLCMLLFSAVFGLYINLCLPLYSWKKPEEAVKQSAAALIGGLGPVLTALLCGLVLAAVKAPWSGPLISLLLLAAAAVLYGAARRKTL